MAIAGLALLIPQVLPVLTAVAAALAGVAILSGQGEETRQLLEEARDATRSTALSAYRNLRDHFASLLSQPMTQEALRDQGITTERLIAQVSGATQAKIDELRLPVSLVAPGSREALLSWWSLYKDPIGQGWYTEAEAKELTEHFARWWLYFNAQEAGGAQAPTPPWTPPVPVPPSVQQIIDAFRASFPPINLHLPALNVVVQQPAITIPAPNVVVNNPPFPDISKGFMGLGNVLGGVGVGSLTFALSSALSATAGPRAHAGQQARYSCQGSFGPPLGEVSRNLLPSILSGSYLLFGSVIREGIESFIKSYILRQADPSQFSSPASEQTAVDSAAQRVVQAIAFGLQAHNIALSAEAMTPLKQMGFDQLGAFMAKMAGFDRISEGLVGTVEDAAIYQPLRWIANRRFRPRLPSDQIISLMYQKRSLTREELVDYLQRQGLDDTVINRTPGYIFNDPNPGLLIRAFQMAEPGVVDFSQDDQEIMSIAGIDPTSPDAYFQLKFAKSGLDPTDVKAFVPVVRMGILRREQTLRYGQIERMNREGMITRERARVEIEAARVPTGVVEYRLAAMDLQVEYETLNEFRGLVLAAFSKEKLSASEASTALVDAGFNGQRVRLWMLSKLLGLSARGAGSEGITPTVDLALAEMPD